MQGFARALLFPAFHAIACIALLMREVRKSASELDRLRWLSQSAPSGYWRARQDCPRSARAIRDAPAAAGDCAVARCAPDRIASVALRVFSKGAMRARQDSNL